MIYNMKHIITFIKNYKINTDINEKQYRKYKVIFLGPAVTRDIPHDWEDTSNLTEKNRICYLAKVSILMQAYYYV